MELAHPHHPVNDGETIQGKSSWMKKNSEAHTPGHRAHVESLAAESRRKQTLQNKKLERRNREWEAKVQHEEERENWSEKSKIIPGKSAIKVEKDSSEAKPRVHQSQTTPCIDPPKQRPNLQKMPNSTKVKKHSCGTTMIT